MTRDVTWRPVKKPSANSTTRTRLIILAVLLAVNLGVILYHGDPRDQMARASLPPAAAEPSPAAPSEAPDAALTDSATGERAHRPEPTLSGAGESTHGELSMGAHRPEPALSGVGESAHGELSAGPPESLVDPLRVDGLALHFEPLVGMRTPARVQRVDVIRLHRGETVAAALDAAGAASEEVHEALHSLKDIVSFRTLRPGNMLKARFDAANRLISIDIQSSLLDRVRAERQAGSWQARALDVRVDSVTAQVSGEIQSSLWEALIGNGERPQLVAELVGIFAWDLDFYRDIYPGDTFRLLVEKRFVDGELIAYGPIHAAEFVSDGMAHLAFRFERDDGVASYYDPEGRSMRKQLLKSPLEYGRMTSGFGRRKHPVLGYSRAHNGVDYGVPIGTPVWTVGDGRVIRAGWAGGFGKLIEVRHANGWVSQYAHLSKIGVRVGQRVSQKDVIGAVGSTGLSTGPHLHYGLKKNGRYVNPAMQRFERGKSLQGAELERYLREVERYRVLLDEIRIAGRLELEAQRDG